MGSRRENIYRVFEKFDTGLSEKGFDTKTPDSRAFICSLIWEACMYPTGSKPRDFKRIEYIYKNNGIEPLRKYLLEDLKHAPE